MTIAQIQEFLSKLQNTLDKNFGNELTEAEQVFANMTKISEEVGELAEQVLLWNKRQRTEKGEFNKEEMESEIADVVLATAMMACKMDVDLTKAVYDKIQKIKSRFSIE